MHDRLPDVAHQLPGSRLEVTVQPAATAAERVAVGLHPGAGEPTRRTRAAGARARRRGRARFPDLRVLIVEDEFMVALSTEETVSELGCTVVATAPDFGGAVQAAGAGNFDVALLDINLNGEDVYPVAEHLLERGVPFLFITGYADRDLPERFRPLPRIQKPLDPVLLERWLRTTFSD